jgi:hypothetical protein
MSEEKLDDDASSTSCSSSGSDGRHCLMGVPVNDGRRSGNTGVTGESPRYVESRELRVESEGVRGHVEVASE